MGGGISKVVFLNLGRLRAQQDLRGLIIVFSVARETPILESPLLGSKLSEEPLDDEGPQDKEEQGGSREP